MNWNASGETDPVVTVLIDPDLESRTVPAPETAEGDWLCAWCHKRVANERDRFSFKGKDEFTFSNPEGFRFDIITFSETCGCENTGVPTLEHTWFSGHAWSYCQCADCGRHLGWHFSGQHEFTGLIKDRIVRALLLRN